MQVISRQFLPTTTRSVHASTIEFWNNHPVFSWFGGTQEGGHDTAIYVYNLQNKEDYVVVGDRDTMPRWNPILFAFNEKLFLFEKIGQFCDRWQTFIHEISEWDSNIPSKQIRATAQILPAGLNGPVKTKPLLTKNGNIVCGSSVETFCDWTSYFEFYNIEKDKWVYVDRSDPINLINKVRYTHPLSGRQSISLGLIQPAMWEQDNKLNSFFRSSSGLDVIYYCNSKYKNGVAKHLSKDPQKTNLKNPNSGIDVVFYNNRLFLVSNPSSLYRFPLVIQEIKLVNGLFEIKDEVIINDNIDENSSCISQELSYPYMVENEGKLHLVYTYGRTKIEYCVIEI